MPTERIRDRQLGAARQHSGRVGEMRVLPTRKRAHGQD